MVRLRAKVVTGDKVSRDRDISEFGDADKILAITTVNAQRINNPYFTPDKLSEGQKKSFNRWLEDMGMQEKSWIQIDSVTEKSMLFEGSMFKKCWCITVDREEGKTHCQKCNRRR